MSGVTATYFDKNWSILKPTNGIKKTKVYFIIFLNQVHFKIWAKLSDEPVSPEHCGYNPCLKSHYQKVQYLLFLSFWFNNLFC